MLHLCALQRGLCGPFSFNCTYNETKTSASPISVGQATISFGSLIRMYMGDSVKSKCSWLGIAQPYAPQAAEEGPLSDCGKRKAIVHGDTPTFLHSTETRNWMMKLIWANGAERHFTWFTELLFYNFYRSQLPKLWSTPRLQLQQLGYAAKLASPNLDAPSLALIRRVCLLHLPQLDF